jgi:hypothetical protein
MPGEGGRVFVCVCTCVNVTHHTQSALECIENFAEIMPGERACLFVCVCARARCVNVTHDTQIALEYVRSALRILPKSGQVREVVCVCERTFLFVSVCQLTWVT